MGFFSSGKDKAAAPGTPAQPADPARPAGKTAATPTRREAEAARRQRLNPQLTPKEARLKARSDSAAQQRKAMAAADAVPGRVLMRDHVDARFSPAEFSMPVMMVLLALSLGISPFVPEAVLPTLWATWGYLGFVVVDMVLLWRQFKKLAAQRIPNEPLKGLLNYGFNRTLAMRRLRQPPPRVKRGDKI